MRPGQRFFWALDFRAPVSLSPKQATQAQLTKIRTNQQRISQALAKLQNFSASSQHTELRASVDALHASYLRLKQRSPREEPTSEQELMLDLAERENANNLKDWLPQHWGLFSCDQENRQGMIIRFSKS